MTRPRSPFAAGNFSIVLGLSGLGQAWRSAPGLWRPGSDLAMFAAGAGEAILALAAAVWFWLIVTYAVRAIRVPQMVRSEFLHPVQGATPALIGIATLLLAPAAKPYSLALALAFLSVGFTWHLAFSLWHTGAAWQLGRHDLDLGPTIYLPTVAGNFTSAAAFGAVGWADVGWLCLGAGIFSWLALESLIMRRLWHRDEFPVERRSTLGIQFAPPTVAGSAWLILQPIGSDHWVLMLWGYGLFQLMLAARLAPWLREQPFSQSYWSYTFAISTTTIIGVKLAKAGLPFAGAIAPALLVGASAFIGWLTLALCRQILVSAFSRRASNVNADDAEVSLQLAP